MSVIIPGMNLPEYCYDCPCHNGEYGYCQISKDYIMGIERPAKCPLVSVPPHGRLIAEADAIETAWMILTGLGYRKEENPQLEQTVREVFATAPGNEVD